MTRLAPDAERERLERTDHRIEEWIASIHRAIEEMIAPEADRSDVPRKPKLDTTQLELMVETSKRFALRLNQALPLGLDVEAVSEIRKIILDGIQKAEEADRSRPLDLLDDIIVRAESIRHILRDALDEDINADVDSSQELARRLVEWLPRAPQRELARLVGVDLRTFQRWLKSPSRRPPPHRLELVARLVAMLRRAWTDEGVVSWFDRPRHDLGDQAPIDLLDSPARERDLLMAARQGRAQHGS